MFTRNKILLRINRNVQMIVRITSPDLTMQFYYLYLSAMVSYLLNVIYIFKCNRYNVIVF